jgi:RimJ/RimL family protein N-acetyltransferase
MHDRVCASMSIDDIAHILAHLRPRDEEELREYGREPRGAAHAFADNCVLGRCFGHDGVPAAVVAFHALTPRTLAVSLVATEAWARVARAVLRWGVREARPELLARGFERAECRTMEGHDDAIRLLERLGFRAEARIERYGASGRTFIQYAWRLSDHVMRET